MTWVPEKPQIAIQSFEGGAGDLEIHQGHRGGAWAALVNPYSGAAQRPTLQWSQDWAAIPACRGIRPC